MSGPREDRFIAPGTKVRRDALFNDDEHVTSEYGIVVHCWMSEEFTGYDCYIAFFGERLPNGAPDEKPYLLRTQPRRSSQ